MMLPEFIMQLDKKAFRAIGVTGLMFALVIAMVVFGRQYFEIDETLVQKWFNAVAGSVWAIPVTCMVFILAAFIGAPQWVLIAGAVVAFGPTQGALVSWGATLLSASVDFWIGRAVGAKRMQRFGGKLVNRMTNLVKRNGFFTSFTVRLLPTAPFVLVNMAAGVSRMTFPAFVGGTALGIIPKIAIIAFIGQSFVGFVAGNRVLFVLGLAGAIGLVFAVTLFARHRLIQREGLGNDQEPSDEVTGDAKMQKQALESRPEINSK